MVGTRVDPYAKSGLCPWWGSFLEKDRHTETMYYTVLPEGLMKFHQARRMYGEDFIKEAKLKVRMLRKQVNSKVGSSVHRFYMTPFLQVGFQKS
jgi:hypothetical protein